MQTIRDSAIRYARQTGMAVYLYECVLAVEIGKPALVRINGVSQQHNPRTNTVNTVTVKKFWTTGRVLHANAKSGLMRTATAIWLPRVVGRQDHFGLE